MAKKYPRYNTNPDVNPFVAIAIDERLAALRGMPKTHAVVTTFADGTERRFETRNAASAEVYAVGERHKIGRNLINRHTGAAVRVVSVRIELLGEVQP